jgi:hypothetical protein
VLHLVFFVHQIYSFPSRPDLVLYFISLVLADVPIHLEKLIGLIRQLSLQQFGEPFEILEGQIDLLHGVEQALTLHLKISNHLNLFAPLEYAIDHTQTASDNGHKRGVVGIFHALIDHIEVVAVVEDVPDENEVSCPVQPVIGFVHLVHQG